MTSAAGPDALGRPRTLMHRQYARAPIVEAVIALELEPRPEFRVDALRPMIAAEATRYGNVEEIADVAAGAEVSFGETEPTIRSTASRERSGYLLRDTAGAQAVQLHRARFAFIKQAPYSGWEAFRNEARRLWATFTEVAPATAAQLGLRYINRLDLPLDAVDVGMFLRTRPEIGENLPANVIGFTMELQLPQPDMPGTLVVLRQTAVPPPNPGVFSILLDIDVMRSARSLPGDVGIWESFEMMHEREHQYFEGSITDHLRELID